MVAIAQSPQEKAAARREQAVEYARQSAFLGQVPPPQVGLPDRLLDDHGFPFGPPLCKLTPWRHHLLLGYSSPFITGRPKRRRHLWQALYLCSPRFRAGSKLAFMAFQVRTFIFVALKFAPACRALDLWLTAPFAFMPPVPARKSDGAGRPAADTHWLIMLGQVARQAGFNPVEILHVPYVILWQSLSALPRGKDQPKFNRPVDKARGEYLRSLQAEKARAGTLPHLRPKDPSK